MFYDQKPTILCLMGPTASGKTTNSLFLASQLPCEIISVDSAMVYIGMDIGTAKPSREERKEVPHHLIDIKHPTEAYSAAEFRQDALSLIDAILARKKIPLLVGGTMLYFRALRDGLSDLPQADPEVRKQILAEAKEVGWAELHHRLSRIDPKAAELIKKTDPQRISRALEVYELTAKPMTQLWLDTKELPLPFNVINLALLPNDRQHLHERIALRLQQMLAQGFVAEVEKLFQHENIHSDLPAIRSVGYRQIWQYLKGEISFAEMQEKATAATRQLAKRQLTWLRSWPDIVAFDSDEERIGKKILHYLASLSTKF